MATRQGWMAGLKWPWHFVMPQISCRQLLDQISPKHCPALFLCINHLSENHGALHVDKNTEFQPGSPDQFTPLVHFAWDWVMSLVYFLLQCYNLQMVHMLNPTPLSIWQIHTPEAQASPLEQGCADAKHCLSLLFFNATNRFCIYFVFSY